MKRSKGMMASTAVLGLTVVLAGCSGESGPADKLSTGPIPDAKATLTVWSFLPSNYPAGPEAYNELIKDFQALHPQVTINLVDMPYGTYFDQVRNSLVAQSGPDVITMYGAAQAYSYKNGLFPLQDVISADLRPQLKFVDENYSIDGNLYIVPTGSYGYVMLANVKKFAEAGIDPKTATATWSGLLETCKSLSQKGIQPISSGWKDGYLLETYMYMFTSQMMDKPTLAKWVKGELKMDDKIFVDAANYVLEMNAAGCFGDDRSLGRNMYDDTTIQYSSGESAMHIVGNVNGAASASSDQTDTIVLPLPQVPNSVHASMIDAGAEGGWAVTKWTKNPEAAAAFVNFIAGKEAQEKLWDRIAVPPNLADFKASKATEIQAEYLALLANKENHTGFAAYPLPVLAVIERNAVPLLSGTMPTKEFIDAAQSAYSKIK
ncbi:UNVERIFIED_ORG: extracellular solute-binding protein (plasmid) [Roseateles sp. XES5]|nr:extracellular solute-binding protein [Roseateles sp. XES5]